MDTIVLNFNFGQDGESSMVTILPQTKVDLVLRRSEYLLDVVNRYVRLHGSSKSIELNINPCLLNFTRNFTLGFFMKNVLQLDADVKRCIDSTLGILIPLIALVQLEKDFVKLLLPRRICKKIYKDIYSLWLVPSYTDIISNFYLFDKFDVSSADILTSDDFKQFIFEVKTVHDDYLVNTLPTCICPKCTAFRSNRSTQFYEGTYTTPGYGPNLNSPFKNMPGAKAYKFGVVDQDNFLNMFSFDVNSEDILTSDDFKQFIFEDKTVHDDYLVNTLPTCICPKCTAFRSNRSTQFYEGTYTTPCYGPNLNSPFKNMPGAKAYKFGVVDQDNFLNMFRGYPIEHQVADCDNDTTIPYGDDQPFSQSSPIKSNPFFSSGTGPPTLPSSITPVRPSIIHPPIIPTTLSKIPTSVAGNSRLQSPQHFDALYPSLTTTAITAIATAEISVLTTTSSVTTIAIYETGILVICQEIMLFVVVLYN
ncbi:unnamed protein product [Mytilus edulis]|uniref:Uncharacterized protein n=1 Tax=Mytilus edulis TaxID=6550 RepID=A0A8S3S3J8_MYTED|nr:unnamed protein product [Mytilus edulis]